MSDEVSNESNDGEHYAYQKIKNMIVEMVDYRHVLCDKFEEKTFVNIPHFNKNKKYINTPKKESQTTRNIF